MLMSELLSARYESRSLFVRLFLLAVDLAGSVAFSPFRLYRRLSLRYRKDDILKILVLRLDGLGDVVLSSAALRELRRGFPRAEITLVVGPWSAGIAGCLPFYDHLVVHDCFLFSVFRGARTINLQREWAFIRAMRRQKFDLGIDLRGDLLSIIPLFLSGARHRVSKKSRGGGFLLTRAVAWDRDRVRHERDMALKVVESLDIDINKTITEIIIPPDDLGFAKAFLKDIRSDNGTLFVTVAPCALYQLKSWPPEYFSHLVSHIVRSYNARIVFIGLRQDRQLINSMLDMAGGNAVNTAGDLSLSKVAALIKLSSVFIGNDSGLIHIAAAVQTPMIQLFGPGDPERFGYRSDREILLHKTRCTVQPCSERTCRHPGSWCMRNITVDDVMDAFSVIVT